MKYGQQLEHESVPEWSLHNLDYNSLKHQIKVHTTRDQASAMAIPGHPDVALAKFEDGLYSELCLQHDRLGLFVTSKADEISRRLEHLNSYMQRWIRKCAGSDDESLCLKRQRRFAKCERELLRFGNDVLAFSRFANAQVVAFRKILKKYRKWTGSTALMSRFNEDVLGNPKSFTRRDLTPLQARHDDILAHLRAAAPQLSEPSSPSSYERSLSEPPSPSRPRVSFAPLPLPRVKYWNEYDDGSEAGGPDDDDDYVIYVNPDEQPDFPGLACVRAMVAVPYEKARQWLRRRSLGDEQRPLMAPAHAGQAYAATTLDSSEEEGYASSDALPCHGYVAHYALPSVNEQRVARYRERVLLRGSAGCLLASFVLLGVAGTLMATGRRRLCVEVDAGVTVGVMASFLCACAGLGMTLYRRDALPLTHRLAVWGAFAASCLLNGMLLVLVVGSTP